MKTTERASGVKIKVPANYRVADIPKVPRSERRVTRGRVFGAIPMPQDQGVTSDDEVASVFEQQDMDLVDQFELNASNSTGGTRREISDEVGSSVEFTLPVAAHEDAVVLLAQEGLYSWRFPAEVETETLPSRRRGEPAITQRRIRFEISISGEVSPKRRFGRRGILEDLVAGQVKAYVFKFAARVAVGQMMKYLERNVRRGFVNMSDPENPINWERELDLGSMEFPKTVRPAFYCSFTGPSAAV